MNRRIPWRVLGVARFWRVSGVARFWRVLGVARFWRVPDAARGAARRCVRRRARGDRGVAALEYLGMLPFLLLTALTGIQLGLVAYCGQQAGTAARTAARTAAEHAPHPDAGEAGRNAVSDWLRDDTTIDFPLEDGTTVKATATIRIPSVLPGVSFFDPVTRSATMPREDTP